MDFKALKLQLNRHDGRRYRPYKDSKGILTCGVGRNLQDVMFSDDEIDLMLENDIQRAVDGVAKYPWFKKLSQNRQAVLLNMCFQMGAKGLIGFFDMVKALQKGDLIRAAIEMENSKWAKVESPNRARELIRNFRGDLPPQAAIAKKRASPPRGPKTGGAA